MLNKIAGKKVLVLGLGRSGCAAVHLLVKAGASVVANDHKEPNRLPKEIAALLRCPQVQIVGGGHPFNVLEGISLIIKSPGIKPELPLLQDALQQGIPVISEIELAFHFCRAPLIGITGTNGKTTTTSLVGEMFSQQFAHVYKAGNIGFPLCEAVDLASEGDMVVAELSSFQLENIAQFKAHIAVVLNITPDHLDYHKTQDNYVAAKKKLLLNQDSNDWTILNWDDPQVRQFAAFSRGKLLPFSRREELDCGVYLRKNMITVKAGANAVEVCAASEVRIPGLHNLENALAAVAVAWAGGVRAENIARVLKNFPGVPHRLERVAVIAGVTFINDSKGTNPDATLHALRAVRGPKVLIAGGLNKQSNFRPLVQALDREDVRYLVLLGETAPLLAFIARDEGFSRAVIVPDLPAAVAKAFSLALPGDTVLLSPACASWDMFKNFEERGEVFKSAVYALKEGLGNEKSPHRA